MRAFARAKDVFAGTEAGALARLAALAADLVLVTDGEGSIVDFSLGSEVWAETAVAPWVGRPLEEAVAPDSRAKWAEMVEAGAGPLAPRWRQLNLRLADGESQVAACVLMRLPPAGLQVLAARSLQHEAQLQQRLVQAQQTMERDYWQFRQAETRYRQLFSATSEGVLLLDAGTLVVAEVNPAACRLLEVDEAGLVGRPLPGAFGPEAERLRGLLAGVRESGRAVEATMAVGAQRTEALVAASAYRQGGVAQLLLRLVRQPAAVPEPAGPRRWAELARSTPDALLLTDAEGRVVAANPAFLELAQLGAEDQAVGRSLDRWLGRSGVDLSVLLSNLRQRGMVRLFATQLRGEYGASAEVEIAGVQVSEAPAMLGFAVRDVGRRLSAPPRGGQELPRSVAQLTELVGRVPLKDIVGETTDLIEQLCIEAALELTRGNRAQAAEMLGLSRQSLYVKLRRFGTKDLGIEDEK